MIGKIISDYKIVSVIGQGGMGTVYLAENIRMSEDKVAIKMINATMINDFTRGLLEGEAKRLLALHHQNIVSFRGYHVDADGNVFLIMEYADGDNLDHSIREITGLIVQEKIYPMFAPILDAVGYAHKKNIVHRDIKPANIVIANDGTPKVLDFGIAKMIDQDENAPSVVMGTPSYMSPEQANGEALDGRSDIYSLGVLLHYMMTGKPPYDTTTLSEQQICQKVATEPLPRMRTFYPHISNKVQQVVDKATAKDPANRYQTCEEFKHALHRAIYPWRPTLWMKIAAAAAVVLLVGGGLWIWDYNRVKTFYYKDYTERWGIPEGIGKLSSGEHSRISRSYKFVYQKRKLLRVSHVNSLDYIIKDTESERRERPADQTFTYTGGGKVSRVKVKDGSGKVLYVKSYNEKLNTMTYEYDDEHGTARTISNTTVGYGNPLGDDGESRGRISRWWIDYDEDGFVTRERFAAIDNSPVGDENKIFGRTYKRDDKGRAIEIRYIDSDGQPMPTRWGLGIKKFTYDEDDNWVRADYLTVDGKPALDAKEGVGVYVMEYDENGNVTYALHKNHDGELMLPKMNSVAGVHFTYDERGFRLSEEFLDTDKQPAYVKGNGFAIRKYEHDEHGYPSKVSYYTPEGELTACSDGSAIYQITNDEHGNIIEGWYKDVDGQLCEIQKGYAGFKARYDTIGNQTRIIFYDKEKELCADNDGAFGYAFAYDERSLCTEMTTLDVDQEPMMDKNGVVIARYRYDKRGNLINMTFYQADGESLMLSNEGCAGWNDIYDERGLHAERNFFGTDGNPILPSGIHYAKVKYAYDENGYLSSVRYYNLQGNLTYVKGVAGYDYVKDKNDNVLESKPIGTDGGIAPNKLVMKSKYDSYNNCTESVLYDGETPAINSDGIHKYAYTYNSRNDVLEMRYYGTDGKLTLSLSNHYAVQQKTYNDRGDRTKCCYLGTDEQPIKCAEGWSSATYEYDAFGNIIKQCFFDTAGQPTDPEDMVPVGIARYDKWGNCVYLAAQDGNGNNIIYPDKGWSICRSDYDNRGNCLSTAYFNQNDTPMLILGAYHKQVAEYDKQGRKTTECYYGTQEEPVLLHGRHKDVYTYVENSDNESELRFYGINDEAVNCDDGWHRRVTSYDESGNMATTLKYYAADDRLLLTRQRNGDEWVTVQREYYWQDEARSIAAIFPYNYGSQMYGLTIQSLTITGSNSCALRFTIPYTASQLDANVLSGIKEMVSNITKELEKQLRHKPFVTGTLYDSRGKLIYSVRY